MAEEAQYSSGTDSTTPHKRKYDDQPNDKPTGFSAGPATGIELANQRAQEVTAHLLSGAPPLVDANKRPRPDSGFDSLDAKPQYSSVPPVSYAHQGTSKKIDIPNGKVGVIIGKAGETIKYLQLQSGAKIQVTRDMDVDPNSLTRMVELMGTPDAIAYAEKLINEVIAEAESGSSGIIARRLTGQSGSDEFSMKIPNNKVGLIIGKGGETIKNMQVSTGARIHGYSVYWTIGDTNMNPFVGVPSACPGYGQPPAYDQQQGYGSATGGYGSGNNPAQEGHTGNYASQGDLTQATSAQPTTTIPQQGYPASQQPGSNTASYPPQGTQTSYGVPPTSQAAYGNQPQPSYGTPQS
ncbi:hypothetical protein Fmac_000535 [Flemingia macrophylla]|uniref:K Homology domain-containing protein n=1 Tax=Flemingia macrophylla TaxID=520843 RepID=A0ABD1NHC2_9FABA